MLNFNITCIMDFGAPYGVTLQGRSLLKLR
jgi:hypothetical protein